MRVGSVFSLMIGMAVATLCGGCTSTTADNPATAEPGPAMRAAGQPVPASAVSADQPTDENIGLAIRRTLDTDPVSTAGVIVLVDGGNVTLRGSAPNRTAAWKAEGIAHSVKGVKSVMNQIVVNAPSTTPLVAPATAP